MFNFVRAACLLCAVTLSLIYALEGARAQTYNAADDFSTVNNPNGVWSYGYETALNAPFTLYTAEDNFSNIDFWYLNGTGLPDVGKNNTATTQGVPAFLPPGKLMFHPGDVSSLADYASVVRWTAPAAASYQLDTLFTGIDTRIPDVQVYVVRDGTIDFNGIVSGVGATQSYDHVYSLNAGDVLDFIVANNGEVGDHNFTQLDATITAVPEASSLVTMLMVGVSIALSRRHWRINSDRRCS